MLTNRLLRYLPALALALAGSLGACTLTGHAFVRPVGVVIIDEEPPPPRHVVVVQRPGHVWIGGHWASNGGRWVWADGYYQRERADHDWVDGRWEARGHGHVWVEGRWKGRGNGKREKGRARSQDHRR